MKYPKTMCSAWICAYLWNAVAVFTLTIFYLLIRGTFLIMFGACIIIFGGLVAIIGASDLILGSLSKIHGTFHIIPGVQAIILTANPFILRVFAIRFGAFASWHSLSHQSFKNCSKAHAHTIFMRLAHRAHRFDWSHGQRSVLGRELVISTIYGQRT